MLRDFIAYFRHHRAERNGALAMLVIMFLIIIGTHIFTLLYEPPVTDPSEFIALMDSLEKINGSAFANRTAGEKKDSTLELFTFNPNTITDLELEKLGFSDKEITMLRNYQKSGAVFKTKSDVRRLYFMNDARYDSLYPFIDLPEFVINSQNQKQHIKYFSPREEIKWSDTSQYDLYAYNPIICDLNLADTNELKKLPYIGSYFAHQITKRRKELGGFSTLAQLLEIYKMTPETIDKIADKVTIDTSQIIKININTATAQELAAHPYISFALASRIVETRESNGRFENMENLCKSDLLNDELCVKLAAYLTFR